jgi:penicillin G amidase
MALGRSVQVEEERGHPILRFLIGVFVLCLLAAAVVVFGGAAWLRHAMQASLPQLDGELRVSGLTAPVEVRRDAHGVPHIQAANLDDLLFAQGFVTAQDRLWEMDMARRMAAGDAAEILGPSLVDHDRLQRYLLMRPTAERMAAQLSARDRQYFEDYARGVNAYIALHEDDLPAEFRLLHYTPRPWQTVDSILIGLSMVQMLDEHWQDKLTREAVTDRLGPTLAADLYPTGSWRDHPPVSSQPPITAPDQVIPQIPLDSSQSRLQNPLPEVRDLLHLRSISAEPVCRGCTPGSNEWVVSGAHTASGKPILSNDMHLDHQVPNIWYEADLEAAGFHAAGVTVPGVPFVVAGHNAHIAWGFTALYGDTQDLYLEQIHDGQYHDARGWHPLEHDRETIHVRGGHDVVLDVESTGHGPILTPLLPHEHRAITLKWTAYDPSAFKFPLYDLDAASDWTSFRAALSQWWAPTLNVVYADDQGNIGYQAVGYIPLRPGGLMGMPISDSAHEWQGMIAFDTLPSAFNPPNGILATANARVTPDGYPTPLTLEWASPYRNERIWKWLAGKDSLTAADMLKLQTDIYSEVDQEIAQRLAYAIDHATNPEASLRHAADLLRSWDGTVTIDSAPASIVAAARNAFWPMLLEPKLGDEWNLYSWAESQYAMEQILINAPPAWLPKKYSNWNNFLADIVRQGMKREHAPLLLSSWRYGSWHIIDLEHPLWHLLPWFQRWTGTGPQPQSGNTTTVKQVGRTFGPSQRFTIDWSAPDAATENIVMGESGDPLSPWYRDQWPYWYHGKTFALPFSDAAVQQAATHTLRLLP